MLMTAPAKQTSVVVQALNQLLAIHARSLPVYLSDTSPWERPGHEEARQSLRTIADDHRRTVDQIAAMVNEFGGDVNMGDFPLLYTSFNDLSVDFLLRKAVEFQRRELQVIDECIETLATAPRAKALAQEIRGSALGHLDSLVELTQGSSVGK